MATQSQPQPHNKQHLSDNQAARSNRVSSCYDKDPHVSQCCPAFPTSDPTSRVLPARFSIPKTTIPDNLLGCLGSDCTHQWKRWLLSSPSLADCLFHCHHRSNARCNEQPGSKKLGTITDSSGSILTNLTQLSTFTGLPYTDQYLPCYEVPCVIYFTLPGDTCCVLQQPACRRKRTRPFLIRNCVTPPSPRADGITKTSRLCASIVDSRRSCFGCLRFRKIL